MSYKSENIEKLKMLSDQIVTKELSEIEERKCLICSLEKIYEMLEKPRINKIEIRDQIKSLIEKIASI